MTTTPASTPEPEYFAPATDSSATTTMPTRSSQEYQFLPSVFIIKYGKSQDSIMPHHLVPGTDRASLTVEHLSLLNFWRFLRREFGAKPATHRLLAYVPGECGGPEQMVDMKNRRIWLSQLQHCHNAGWNSVVFLIQERQVGDDDVAEIILEDDDAQRKSWIRVLGWRFVPPIVFVVLASMVGQYASASG
ncbi:hypothetical protein HBI70_075160 [Parastagonospora nodorum]|nr:hypothetical protein HBH51_160700 [Parastagonospora nodorum]KAH3997397.1 hypothetical protein HBI10_144330 [Parastagonospora nodorum]KAH4021184.1 hypothetical protein HBI13_112630 [Parastagonospora nodorum]KAH4108078.1 hypothetical protein HBH46_055350 [Parastagonospora nodorum]KAH4176567.1 hypothetical protein HBH43_060630 [Parastagonospora nodorum]